MELERQRWRKRGEILGREKEQKLEKIEREEIGRGEDEQGDEDHPREKGGGDDRERTEKET